MTMLEEPSSLNMVRVTLETASRYRAPNRFRGLPAYCVPQAKNVSFTAAYACAAGQRTCRPAASSVSCEENQGRMYTVYYIWLAHP